MLGPSDPRAIDSTGTEEDDCYFDGPYLVFTEAYHRKRGFCCQSGCRHCPYGFVSDNPDPPPGFRK
ncbi:MAG: DUF5522 domain-containing protein [Acidobacteriaceae bacterium]